MAKVTKSSITRRLDKICSEIVRSRGKCEKCGNAETLQCCHIFSRTYRSVRFDLDNLLCLCAKCHAWAHAQPTRFTEFVKSYLGSKYEILDEKFREISHFKIQDLEDKYKVLTDILSLGQNSKNLNETARE